MIWAFTDSQPRRVFLVFLSKVISAPSWCWPSVGPEQHIASPELMVKIPEYIAAHELMVKIPEYIAAPELMVKIPEYIAAPELMVKIHLINNWLQVFDAAFDLFYNPSCYACFIHCPHILRSYSHLLFGPQQGFHQSRNFLPAFTPTLHPWHYCLGPCPRVDVSEDFFLRFLCEEIFFVWLVGCCLFGGFFFLGVRFCVCDRFLIQPYRCHISSWWMYTPFAGKS